MDHASTPDHGIDLACDIDVVFCPDCQDHVLADRPPCADGHGSTCPDRACSQCGAALIADGLLLELVTGRSSRRNRNRRGRRDAA